MALQVLCRKQYSLISMAVYIITNSMELSTTRETISCETTRDPPSTLWNPKVHYHINKSSPLVLILRETNTVITPPPPPILSLEDPSILSTHLRLGFPSDRFSSHFHTHNINSFLFSPQSCYISRPFHSPI
jgi:hypothetical protein